MHNRWIMLAVLTMARLAMGFQFQSIGSTAPFLVEGLGIDYASVGFLIGLFLLPGVVLAIPGGFLGQVFGDKRVVAFGLALMAGGDQTVRTRWRTANSKHIKLHGSIPDAEA